MKRSISLVLCLLLAVSLFAGCAATTPQPTTPAESAAVDSTVQSFTDDAGRTVELPAQLTKVSPSGAVAQMILMAVAPERLVSLAGAIGEENAKYYSAEVQALPVTGQFFGKGDLNAEALISTAPQVIIDLGDKKDGIEEDLDAIQEQTGIPVIFIKATTETYADAFRKLGKLLDAAEQGETLAKYTEETLAQAAANREKITDENRLSVMFGTGDTGLNCNAKGSIHCGVLEAVGVENAIEVPEVSNKGGGNAVTMEEVIKADPDVVLLDVGGPYATVGTDSYWASLTAVQEGKYYEIPCGPYHFLASPPSINQIIGIKWLGNLLYPELYDFDMITELQSFYKLFWHYELSEDEAAALLANSTLKTAQ